MKHNSTLPPGVAGPRGTRGGFTLIEIVIVIPAAKLPTLHTSFLPRGSPGRRAIRRRSLRPSPRFTRTWDGGPAPMGPTI